ncbi:hypothetical protein WG954_10100 [Lacibacter sp. H375]|uniref:hypothetical protein n=1 Tax=Lacibacter sp. H375 TaxID=3133424 RepID=UPI0030C00C3B
MKAKLLFLFVFASLLAGCGKDKYTTKPQVEIKSIKQGEVFNPAGGNANFIEFDLTVTDKEGDAQGEIIIDKLDAPSPACQLNSFTDEVYTIPNFPGEPNQKVNVKVKYASGSIIGYGTLSGNNCNSQPHIAIFRFRIVDKTGDTSNAVQSDPITLPF